MSCERFELKVGPGRAYYFTIPESGPDGACAIIPGIGVTNLFAFCRALRLKATEQKL